MMAAAAAVLAPALGVAYYVMQGGGEVIVASSKVEQARKQREQAKAACGRQEWAACRDLLDKARELDPDGDKQDPDVQGMRRTLAEKLPPADPE